MGSCITVMTDSASTRDALIRDSGARRQHAPADVAPELYDATDDTAGCSATDPQ
jgi:hypothetical protein